MSGRKSQTSDLFLEYEPIAGTVRGGDNTLIPAGVMVTLKTFNMAFDNSRLAFYGYINENVAGASWCELSGIVALGAVDVVQCWFERTANPGEVLFRAVNNSGVSDRTLKWCIVEYPMAGL